MKRTPFFLGILLLLALSSGQAFADLLGANVTVEILYPNQGTVFNVFGTGTVTAGGLTLTDTEPGGPFYSVTVFPTEVTLTNISGGDILTLPGSFNGLYIHVNSGGSAINGATLAIDNISPGLSPSDVTFDATDLWLNAPNRLIPPGLDLQVDLQFVPEPSAMVLLGSGLLGLIGAARKKLLL